MKVTFFNLQRLKTVILKKINIIYGCNNSGKTKLLELFRDGFLGKLKEDFKINDESVEKNQYDVFYFDCKEDINDHFKNSSKSILTNVILSKIFSDSNEKELNDIKKFIFEQLNELANKSILDNGFGLSPIVSEDKIANLLSDAYEFKYENEKNVSSSGISKKLLFQYCLKMPKKAKTSIFLFDNFDNDFDLRNSLSFIKYIVDLDGENHFIFTTPKSSTFEYIFDNQIIKPFYLYNQQIHDFINIKQILKESLIKYYQENDKSTDFDYLIQDCEIDKMHQKIVLNNLNKIGVLITNPNCLISNDGNNDFQVKIRYDSEVEKTFLENFLFLNQ